MSQIHSLLTAYCTRKVKSTFLIWQALIWLAGFMQLPGANAHRVFYNSAKKQNPLYWIEIRCHGTKSLFDGRVHVFEPSLPDSDPSICTSQKTSFVWLLMLFTYAVWSVSRPLISDDSSGSFDAVHHLLMLWHAPLLPTDEPTPAPEPCNADGEQCV